MMPSSTLLPDTRYEPVEGIDHPKYALANITEDVTVTLFYVKDNTLTVSTASDVSTQFEMNAKSSVTTTTAADIADGGTTTIASAVGETITIEIEDTTTAPDVAAFCDWTVTVTANGAALSDEKVTITPNTDKNKITVTFAMPGYDTTVAVTHAAKQFNVTLDASSTNIVLKSADGSNVLNAPKATAKADFTFSAGYADHYKADDNEEIKYSIDGGATWKDAVANTQGKKIPAADVTGDIIIKVTPAQVKTSALTITVDGAVSTAVHKVADDGKTVLSDLWTGTNTTIANPNRDDGAFTWDDKVYVFVETGNADVPVATQCAIIGTALLPAEDGHAAGTIYIISHFTGDAAATIAVNEQ